MTPFRVYLDRTIIGHRFVKIQELTPSAFLTADLNNGGTVLDQNGNDITALLNQALAPGATVKLGGCHTAADSEDDYSLAQKFSNAVPAASVSGYTSFGLGLSSVGSIGFSATFEEGDLQ